MYLGYLKFKSPYNGGKEKRKRMKSVSYLMENKTGRCDINVLYLEQQR